MAVIFSKKNVDSDQNWSDDSDFQPESLRREKNLPLKSPVETAILPLKVGTKFHSIHQLEASIADFQKKTNCVFYNRDCVTVQQRNKKRISRPINDALKYYWVKYCCIHGGKKFRSNSKGIRSSSTFQKNCPAHFMLTASTDGKKLVLTKIDEQHNHICSKKLYEHLPQVRGMSALEREKVAELMSLGGNKKKINFKISQESGKRVILKDLSNVMARKGERNNLKNTVQMLQEKYGAECHVFEQEEEMKGLFFATDQMKRSMQSYPEYIGIDATFKLLDIRAPIYLVIVEDSEGSTEIVAVCILVHEDKASMIWLLKTFKTVHPAWTKIRSVMADKDLLERQIIKEEFPSANVLICIFHSLRTFKREIACDKLAITPEQRDLAREIFQKMVYAFTEAEYMTYYEECKKLPSTILDYFNKNWHDIRSEWTLSRDFMQSAFLNTTNNRVESLNAKIKSVIKLYSTLEEFIENFFLLLACLSTERDHLAAYNYQKKLVVPYEENSAEWAYCNLLTRFAFDFVKEELSNCRRGKLVPIQTSNELFEFQLRGSRLHTSSSSCDCPLFASMMLPCRFLIIIYNSFQIHHKLIVISLFCDLLCETNFLFVGHFFSSHIFCVRQRLEYDLFDPSLCIERWTREYYCNTQRVFDETDTVAKYPPSCTVSSKKSKPHISSQNERYRKVFVIAKELAGLAAEVTGDQFINRLNQLDEIRKLWVQNREVSINSVSMLEPIFSSTQISSVFHSDFPIEDLLTASHDDIFSDHEMNRQKRDEEKNREEKKKIPDNAASKKISTGLPKRQNLVATEDISIESISNSIVEDAANSPVETICEGNAIATKKKVEVNLSHIKVPTAMKQKGCPKGSRQTVIGLPRKRKLTKPVTILPFPKLRPEDKSLKILEWLVGKQKASLAVHQGILIEHKFVETRPKNVTDALINDDVNVQLVEKYFSKDAWKIVQKVLRYKRENPLFICGGCTIDLNETVDLNKTPDQYKYSVRCDYCMIWYHLPCASLKKLPKCKFWKCKKCS